MKSIFKFFILFSVVFDVYSQNLKSPSEFLGYEIGTQFSRHSQVADYFDHIAICLLYTSDAADDQ